MDDHGEYTGEETCEESGEKGAENTTSDSVEPTNVTNAETAAAFDEASDTGGADGGEDSASSAEAIDSGGITDSGEAAASTGDSTDAVTAETATEDSETAEKETAEETDTTEKTEESTVDRNTVEKAADTENAEITHVNCTREDLAGKEHPDTGVFYETKVVEVNGKSLEVTVPKFESDFDFKLESDQLQFDRQKHNEICNAKLKEHCENNPDWARETFSSKQLDQINNGKNPEGYTWHHDGGEVGHMQLVDSKIHNDTRHTGGIAIWGRSSKYI